MEQITGKISYKTKNGKAIKLEGDERYLNAYKKEDLDPYTVGQTVEISYNVKGTFNNISKITLIPDQTVPKAETPKATTATTATPNTGYTCTECNKPLKDGKFKKCYECNKKAKEEPKPEAPKEVAKPEPVNEEPIAKEEVKKEEPKPEVYLCNACGAKMKTNKYPTCYTCNKKNPVKTEKVGGYNSPEVRRSIRIGNAINAAASAISGNLVGAEPETLKQALLYIAERALTWIEEKNAN